LLRIRQNRLEEDFGADHVMAGWRNKA